MAVRSHLQATRNRRREIIFSIGRERRQTETAASAAFAKMPARLLISAVRSCNGTFSSMPTLIVTPIATAGHRPPRASIDVNGRATSGRFGNAYKHSVPLGRPGAAATLMRAVCGFTQELAIAADPLGGRPAWGCREFKLTGTTGNPKSIQACKPPARGRTCSTPFCISRRATRALVISAGQEQYRTTSWVRQSAGTSTSRYCSNLRPSIRTAPGMLAVAVG